MWNSWNAGSWGVKEQLLFSDGRNTEKEEEKESKPDWWEVKKCEWECYRFVEENAHLWAKQEDFSKGGNQSPISGWF